MGAERLHTSITVRAQKPAAAPQPTSRDNRQETDSHGTLRHCDTGTAVSAARGVEPPPRARCGVWVRLWAVGRVAHDGW